MEALDGNAIAGPLFESFGTEMTTAKGTCAHCGASSMIGELRVYPRAPGVVARCPICDNVVMVLATIRNNQRVDLTSFRLAETPGDG